MLARVVDFVLSLLMADIDMPALDKAALFVQPCPLDVIYVNGGSTSLCSSDRALSLVPGPLGLLCIL
jgi:hypothetical protein